jgi:alpha-galactosidase
MILLACSSAAISLPAAARPNGVWLFDKAPSYPGVTMLQIDTDGPTPRGSVSTAWYGPIRMENIVVQGDRIAFDLRNLNDRDHPTRRWTATFDGSRVRLTGQMWQDKVTQAGRRGTVKDAEARAFAFATLPPLGVVDGGDLAPTPPMGWSSWNRFAEHIDDATIRAMADAMVSSGLSKAGYSYINIDDGWQGKRGADGRLQPNAKFPDMKALTDYVHARGLKIGIYSSQGPKTCAGYTGSYGHVRQDAQAFADWGFDYLKYDLCSGEWFYADADSVRRSYYEMGAALKATGRPFVYSLCQYGRFDVPTWGRSVGGHLWRTTGDITDDYKTMADIGFDRNPKYAPAGPNRWNDPDMLEVGNGGMSDAAYRTHMTLWAMSAAPLVMGHDLRKTSPSALAILTKPEVIAIDQDRLGIQGTAVIKADKTEIWRKPLMDGRVAVAIFNRDTGPRNIRFDPAVAGLGKVGRIHDVWANEDRSIGVNDISVPAYSVVLYLVSGSKEAN